MKHCRLCGAGFDGASLDCAPCGLLRAGSSLARFYRRCENVVIGDAPNVSADRRARYERILDHLDGHADECAAFEPPERPLEPRPTVRRARRRYVPPTNQPRLRGVLRAIASLTEPHQEEPK